MKPEIELETIRLSFKTVQVPTMKVCGIPIFLKPGLSRIASVKEGWLFDVREPEQIISAIKRSDLRAHLFTFAQRLPFTEPVFSFPRRWDNIAALPTSDYDKWWSCFASDSARNKIRKARKMGVEVRAVDYDAKLIHAIASIYDECPIRQGKPFAHYKKSFEELWQIHETFLDRATFLGAFLRDELIGFVKLVDAGPFVLTMGFISKLAYRTKAPNNALVDAAVKFCCQQKTPFLVYGEFDWGKRGSLGLTEFKKENGFQKILLPRYYVPLTLVGRFILATGLENGLTERMPAPIVRSLLGLRRWLLTLRARSSSSAI